MPYFDPEVTRGYRNPLELTEGVVVNETEIYVFELILIRMSLNYKNELKFDLILAK